MGTVLDKPKTEKVDTRRYEANGLYFGKTEMQGWRPTMEDAVCAIPSIRGHDDCSWVAVYDGHGGSRVSAYSAEKMLSLMMGHPDWGTPTPELLQRLLPWTFIQIDSMMRKDADIMQEGGGSTGVSAFITPKHVIIANCGDSRAVFAQTAGVWQSIDHKPGDEGERKRIEAAGGHVIAGRVNGDLAVSRALGDFVYKNPNIAPHEQIVSTIPDVFVRERTPGDSYLILACDGVWDVFTSADCVSFVDTVVQSGELDMGNVAELLVQRCLDLGSRDNISACVVRFPGAKMPTDEKVEEYRKKRELEFQAVRAGQRAAAAEDSS